ncbi:MAG: NRDE family protein [Gammaproteobacteria bacterium]|nr:NRDE family protein [Gammaproteobacteria bacterium]
MCLVVIAWQAHPRYPLIVAGNRDEFHARPSTAAGWWPDAPAVLGGRDELAGGSWLAVNRNGRFAVVVNDPRRPPAAEQTLSRGQLVRDYVAGDRPSGRFLDMVAVNENRYAGFCLLLGTPVQVRGFVTAKGGAPHRWTMKPGVAAYSNGPIDEPAPKVAHMEREIAALLARGEPDREAMFALLASRVPVAAAEPGLSPLRLLPFVAGEDYGTRATTMLAIDERGRGEFEERRFGPRGVPGGVTRERFEISGR